jgi:hypothetical protein
MHASRMPTLNRIGEDSSIRKRNLADHRMLTCK